MLLLIRSKQIVLNLLAFSMLCASSPLSQAATDRSKAELRGPVQSVLREVSFFIEDLGSLKERRQSVVFVAYDRDGRQSQIILYGKEGIVSSEVKNVYDSTGKLIESNNTIGGTEKFYYDASGNLLKRIHPDGVFDYRYDPDGNLLEEISVDGNGNTIGRATFTYGQIGKAIEEKRFDPDGSLSTKRAFIYDANGNLIERKSYDRSDQLYEKTSWKYNINRQLIESNIFRVPDELAVFQRIEYLYDESDQIAKINFYNMQNQLISKILRTYDSYGNWVIESTEEIDKDGKSKITGKSYRTITYHPSNFQ
ncbi:MAG: RHS repeat protein [Nitrospirae bacterium]|nr:RHS repeat protein [Nitrospirota bacterium]